MLDQVLQRGAQAQELRIQDRSDPQFGAARKAPGVIADKSARYRAKTALPTGCDTARLKTLFKKHHGADYDANLAELTDSARQELADALEVEGADLDSMSPMQVLQIIQDQYDDEDAEELLEYARVVKLAAVTNDVAWQAFKPLKKAYKQVRKLKLKRILVTLTFTTATGATTTSSKSIKLKG